MDIPPAHCSQLILVAIPARNEAETIGDVISAIPRDRLPGYCLETVVFDDASADETAERARRAGATVRRVDRPRGLGGFFRAAVQEALERGADILVNIDGDGQFDPAEIPELVEPIMADRADFVAGDRFPDHAARPPDMSRVKYVGNQWMTSLISRITGLDIRDASSGFRAYSREALLNVNLQSRFTYTQETFLDLAVKGVRVAQVPVTVRYFPERRSRIARSIPRYAFWTLTTIFRTVRDHRPLRTFGTAALILFASGGSLAGFVLWHYLTTGAFSPYIFLVLTSAYVLTLGLIVSLVGIASDMLAPIRRNQETLVYLARRNAYGRAGWKSPATTASRPESRGE